VNRLLTFMGLLMALPAHAQLADNAALWLQEALRGPTTGYAATARTILYQEGAPPVVATVRIFADGKGDVLREYAGPAQGVRLLKRGSAVWQRQPNGEWIRLPDAADADPMLAMRWILDAYRVHAQQIAPVLGLPAVYLDLQPMHPWDPARRIVLSPNTGIILRDELLAPGGKLRSRTEVLQVSLAAQPAHLFQAPTRFAPNTLFGPASFSARPSRAEVERETQRPILLPTYVPPGYHIVLYGVMRTGSGRLMPVVRYSNGISAFSVFQRGRGPRLHPGAPPPPRCIGSSSLQQAVVTVTGHRANYILVGDLAEQILRKVGNSLP